MQRQLTRFLFCIRIKRNQRNPNKLWRIPWNYLNQNDFFPRNRLRCCWLTLIWAYWFLLLSSKKSWQTDGHMNIRTYQKTLNNTLKKLFYLLLFYFPLFWLQFYLKYLFYSSIPFGTRNKGSKNTNAEQEKRDFFLFLFHAWSSLKIWPWIGRDLLLFLCSQQSKNMFLCRWREVGGKTFDLLEFVVFRTM